MSREYYCKIVSGILFTTGLWAYVDSCCFYVKTHEEMIPTATLFFSIISTMCFFITIHFHNRTKDLSLRGFISWFIPFLIEFSLSFVCISYGLLFCKEDQEFDLCIASGLQSFLCHTSLYFFMFARTENLGYAI